jgi:hypothetical protein
VATTRLVGDDSSGNLCGILCSLIRIVVWKIFQGLVDESLDLMCKGIVLLKPDFLRLFRELYGGLATAESTEYVRQASSSVGTFFRSC